MKDEELNQSAQDRHLSVPTPSRFNWKSLLFFGVAMAALWFVGTILTPLFPDEYIAMIIYAILFFFLGFDPTKWIKRP